MDQNIKYIYKKPGLLKFTNQQEECQINAFQIKTFVGFLLEESLALHGLTHRT